MLRLRWGLPFAVLLEMMGPVTKAVGQQRLISLHQAPMCLELEGLSWLLLLVLIP